jgi:amino acid adenylation domain-containing protein
MKHPFAIRNANQTIHARFEEMATQYPDHEAIRFGEISLTYKQLNQKADQIADAILFRLGPQAAQVAIYLEHGISQPLVVLGILKAGKTYAALDTSFPVERNIQMLQNSGSSLVITNNMNISQLKSFASKIPILNADEDIDPEAVLVEKPEVSPDSPAFITYTSGSTGIPKGVVHSHANMLHFNMRMYTLDCTMPAERWAYYYSLSFSAHAMPIFGALLNGATLCIFDLKKDNFTEFSKWLRQEKINITLMIPSVLRQFTATLGSGRRFPQLKKLLLGGETLYRSDVDKIREHLKEDAVIFNIYASSEAYLARAYRIDSTTVVKGNIVPIGYSVPEMDISIEDRDGVRADPYKNGEICIRSEYLALGYWKQEELTNKDFTKNDDGTRTFHSSDLGHKLSDGCVVHVGRSDSMIKLRGYRIDLGEIENTLMDLKQVQEVAVMLKENPFGTKHIIAYYVERENSDLDPHYLKLAIVRGLPEYMVPSFFIRLDRLPKNNIGKVDYKGFPEPDWNSFHKKEDVVMATSGTEEELKEIFERILEVSPLGMTENLMEAGADSLRLFVAFDEVEKRFGKKLSIDSIIEAPFIRDIALQIDEEAN